MPAETVRGSTDGRAACAHWWPGFVVVDPPSPPPPAAIAIPIPMTTAAPATIHQFVPEDFPDAVFFSSASPALAAWFASVSGFDGTPGSVFFVGHVSQASAAIARETDPRLVVRKQAAQRIATTDWIVVRMRGSAHVKPPLVTSYHASPPGSPRLIAVTPRIAGVAVVPDIGEERLPGRLLVCRRGQVIEVAGHVHLRRVVEVYTSPSR